MEDPAVHSSMCSQKQPKVWGFVEEHRVRGCSPLCSLLYTYLERTHLQQHLSLFAGLPSRSGYEMLGMPAQSKPLLCPGPRSSHLHPPRDSACSLPWLCPAPPLRLCPQIPVVLWAALFSSAQGSLGLRDSKDSEPRCPTPAFPVLSQSAGRQFSAAQKSTVASYCLQSQVQTPLPTFKALCLHPDASYQLPADR